MIERGGWRCSMKDSGGLRAGTVGAVLRLKLCADNLDC